MTQIQNVTLKNILESLDDARKYHSLQELLRNIPAVDLAAVMLNRLSIDFWDAPAPFSWILFDENTLSLFSGVFFLGLGAVRAKRA